MGIETSLKMYLVFSVKISWYCSIPWHNSDSSSFLIQPNKIEEYWISGDSFYNLRWESRV